MKSRERRLVSTERDSEFFYEVLIIYYAEVLFLRGMEPETDTYRNGGGRAQGAWLSILHRKLSTF